MKRLPNGTTTQDSELYARTWMAEAEVVEELFPGYTLSSYDPTMTFTNFKTWDHFTLTVPAVQCLKRGVYFLAETASGGAK